MRILTILLTFISCNLFASSDWIHDWISAQESIENNDLSKAEEDFNSAIEIMETNNDIDHPYVYLSRAELYLNDQRFSSALEDLNKAINSQKLASSEKHKANLMRISAKFQIGEKLDDFDLNNLIEWSEIRVDQTKDRIIIRNLPNCSSLKENLHCIFIHSGICERSSDITILNSGTYVIKKRNCKSQENQDQHCDFCGDVLARHQQPVKVEKRTIEGCKGWCDLHVTNAQMWCSNRVKSPCKELCLITLVHLQKGCHWCCSEGAFYEKCVEPFGDILSQLPRSKCDPEWED